MIRSAAENESGNALTDNPLTAIDIAPGDPVNACSAFAEKRLNLYCTKETFRRGLKTCEEVEAAERSLSDAIMVLNTNFSMQAERMGLNQYQPLEDQLYH